MVRNILDKLISKKITCIAFEYIKEDDGSFPVLSQLSEIAGKASILISSELLSNTTKSGKGLFFGNLSGVPPTEIVIIGSGNVAKSAAITATKLGSRVKLFSNSIFRLNQIKGHLGFFNELN